MTSLMISRELSSRAKGYEETLARLARAMAERVAAGARTRVHRNLKTAKSDSPLAESIRVETDPEGGAQVVTDKPYARFVEFGTRASPARPFLTPAVEEVKVTFSGLVSEFVSGLPE